MKSHPFKHLHTINKHRRQVIRNAAKMGIFFHALKHDLSKYSFREFSISSKYWTGTVSPVLMERKSNELFSLICQHHTKRNPHHWEYWTDFYKGAIVVKAMPYKYAVEYVCDMLSASKVYSGKDFKKETTVAYFLSRVDHYYIHKGTAEFIAWCLGEYAKDEFKNLKKKNTYPKYLEIMAKYPKVEVFKKLNVVE